MLGTFSHGKCEDDYSFLYNGAIAGPEQIPSIVKSVDIAGGETNTGECRGGRNLWSFWIRISEWDKTDVTYCCSLEIKQLRISCSRTP